MIHTPLRLKIVPRASTRNRLIGERYIAVGLFDVAALGTVDYVVKFKAYKEGSAGARVTFTNVETGEYLYHDIKAAVSEPGVIDTLALESSIRQVARRLITIDNPLPPDMPLTFPDQWWTCDDPDVQLVRRI